MLAIEQKDRARNFNAGLSNADWHQLERVLGIHRCARCASQAVGATGRFGNTTASAVWTASMRTHATPTGYGVASTIFDAQSCTGTERGR